MHSKTLNIPKYISSFELEEARIGQAIQATKVLLKADILKDVLIMIKDESINAEYALNAIAEGAASDQKSEEQLQLLIAWLLNRKSGACNVT